MTISDTVIGILALVLVIVSVAGVFNALLLNTCERTQDIATLKALGMTPGQVIGMVIASAVVLGSLGGLLGVPLGIWLHQLLLGLTTSSAIGTPLPDAFYQGTFSPAILPLLALGGSWLRYWEQCCPRAMRYAIRWWRPCVPNRLRCAGRSGLRSLCLAEQRRASRPER